MHKTGVIHGRFQIVHTDHMKYLLAGKARCEHLVVGITNPDPHLSAPDSADVARSLPEANPLTYYERYRLLGAALTGEGLSRDEFSIVPFPINFPDLYRYYVPIQAVFFLTIYDDWGRRKLELFQKAALQTEILWEKKISEKGFSATTIRQCIAQDKPWKHMVPGSTHLLLEELDVVARLQSGG